MKKCITCKVEKDVERFSLRRNGKHRVSECKECSAKRSNKWYWENREKSLSDRKERYIRTRDESLLKWKERYERDKDRILKRSRELNKNPERREKANDRSKKWRKNNPEKIRNRVRDWKRNNPLKSIAHQHVLWGLKLGVLKKPENCERCGLNKKLEGHHKDYSKPLEVLWVCKICHEEEHHKEDNVFGITG